MAKKRKNLSEQAYAAVKLAIISCELAPGQQIPLHQLVEKYNFGATPIREALVRLAQEGLVQPIPRFGYIVSHVTLSDIHELYELRMILESAVARMAAVRATDEQIRKISEEAHFTYIFGDHNSYHQFLEQNSEFHLRVARAAGNKRLSNQISQVLDELTRVFHFGLDLRDSAEEMRQEHIELAEALLERDAQNAGSVVSEQIAASLERVLKALTKIHAGAQPGASLHDVHINP